MKQDLFWNIYEEKDVATFLGGKVTVLAKVEGNYDMPLFVTRKQAVDFVRSNKWKGCYSFIASKEFK